MSSKNTFTSLSDKRKNIKDISKDNSLLKSAQDILFVVLGYINLVYFLVHGNCL